MTMDTHQPEDDDYYKILGVTREVSEDGLKQAYRRQALRWHPDKNQHRQAVAAERFKKVSEAYQALRDRRSRAAYNRKRPTAGSNEVLLSKTYGWAGVNISFYWTGPPPKDVDVEEESSPEAKPTPTRKESRSRSEEWGPGGGKSPLELFKDMFEMDSPLAAIDKQLDGFRGQSSIFESVFGSFKSFDSTKEEPCEEPCEEALERQSEQAIPHEHECYAGAETACASSSASSKSELAERIAIIQKEYQKGDLNEDEYKELIALLVN